MTKLIQYDIVNMVKKIPSGFVAKLNKENLIKQIADEYKNKIPEKLYNVMYTYEVDITD